MTKQFILKTAGIFLLSLIFNSNCFAKQLAYVFDVRDVTTDSKTFPDEKGARLLTTIDSKLFLTTKIDEKMVNDSEYLGAFHTYVEVRKTTGDKFTAKIKMEFQFAEFKDKPGVSPATASVVEFEVPSDFNKMETNEFKNGVINQLANDLKKSVFKEAEKFGGNYEPAFKDAFGTKITHYAEQLLYKFPNEIEKMVAAYPEEVKKFTDLHE